MFLGALCGLIEFGLPIEDGIRVIRNQLFQRSADQSITVVAIDDRTLATLKSTVPPRSADAHLVDQLFALGAKRIFFDRAFPDQTSAVDDAALRDAFARHAGKVFIGAVPANQTPGSGGLWPLPMYERAARVLSMGGENSPFELSARFPIRSKGKSGHFVSISAELAHLRPERDADYRPDFSIAIKTIPTVSYIDLLNGRVEVKMLAGRDIIFGPTSVLAHDLHSVPFHGRVPGVYFHVIGAQTLKEGLPLDIGWLPGFAVAAVVLIWLYRRPTAPALKTTGAFATAALFAPLIFPAFSVVIDVIPAILTIVIGGVWLGLERRRRINGVSQLPTIGSLRTKHISTDHQVFALKIRNYASIKASSSQDIEKPLIAEISRRIRLGDSTDIISHDQDTLVWTRPAIALEGLRDHAHGLHALLATGLRVAGTVVDVGVSIGIDVNYGEGLAARIDEAMQCAEDAALAANVCKIGKRSTPNDRAWNVQILTQLEQAMDRGELWVAYQPKVSLLTNEPTGVEALIRWTHPQRGSIEPNVFVPVAELHNRMEPLTIFVLDQALQTLKRINTLRRGFKMSVNISTQMLQSERILQLIDDALRKHRIRPAQLMLEITETAPIETDAVALAVLAKMKARGLQLSIDDFGTGNATLEYLVKIPADEVKIDRMFVTDLVTSRSNRTLARSIIKMAHSLGRTVVAEGIETPDVARALKQMGCDEGQGYLYDKGLSAADLYLRLAQISGSKTG